ncbi:phenylalanine--tRNA ligase subunit beta [Acidisoma cellulosilytica]|uniref:Phenylalanine--tRNA ligase beta subunit n=1 Tax=Acidisoma cellulosilyticum TaxID=2802395 RepID=A0A963Z5Q0_9PROT|nr:phenylalanine--tRNA ligase subunit beta [Acidisoma cellulosilyticum]MCB8883324.1 phenylalanine--tRNA ligase subunit beta [Acidisoma cellulosilyticum]
MKFTLSWLREHLDTDASLETITDKLTGIGLELEGIENPGAALAPFRIGHIIEAVQHPNADRLRACVVDAGEGPVSVVCGAPNARTGIKVVFAPVGATIPTSGLVLKAGEIRGVASNGMLCSARELGLGDDHDGIIELPEDAPVGARFVDYKGLDEPVIEIAVTPNRGDALSVRGVARDLAAAGIGVLKTWVPDAMPSNGPSAITWKIEGTEACSWVLGRTVRGVKNGPSPAWLQDRLRAIGLRPISALVDITNFFTIDLGRPLHVFDVAKVKGNLLTLRSGAGESFLALNGKEVTVTAEDCVIADAEGVVSLAGIVGGEASGCTETTTDVFIECAYFDPIAVALSGRRHQVASDARARFERGIDPALMPSALEAATQMVIELCGGEASEPVAAGAEPAWRRTAKLRFDRLKNFAGADIARDEAEGILRRLGFGLASGDDDSITVHVPSWRNDIAGKGVLEPARVLSADVLARVSAGVLEIEPEVDLVEEVLRIWGIDRVEPVSLPPLGAVPAASFTPRQGRALAIKRLFASRGLNEAVTFSFADHKVAALFGEAPESLRLVNPIASDLDQLRATPLITLSLAAQRNAARGFGDHGLFEVGPAFHEGVRGGQQVVAAGLRLGETPRHWLEPARGVTAMDAKADVWAALTALSLPLEALSVTTDAPGYYHPGRSGVVRQGPKVVLARFGALHPTLIRALDLPQHAVAFEIFLDAIPEPKRRKKAAPELSAFQPVRRDFAFVAASDTAAETVLRAARGSVRDLVTGVTLFDVYEGEKMEPGRKSLGVEVVFQPKDRSLTDAEIEEASAKVIAAVTKATGATLR